MNLMLLLTRIVITQFSVCVCVCVCMYVCAHVCVHMCVCALILHFKVFVLVVMTTQAYVYTNNIYN